VESSNVFESISGESRILSSSGIELLNNIPHQHQHEHFSHKPQNLYRFAGTHFKGLDGVFGEVVLLLILLYLLLIVVRHVIFLQPYLFEFFGFAAGD